MDFASSVGRDLRSAHATATFPCHGAWEKQGIEQCLDEGDSNVMISGGVNPRGRVSVNLRYGQAAAQGSGRLSRSDGQGRWQGASSGSRFSGRWLAERRS